jgi:hypothetical protein
MLLSGVVMKVNGSFSKNVEGIGYCDLDDRPAFKMAIREVAGRWYLYTGHFWHSGWSIVDVTDPAQPRLARFISGPPNTFTLQMNLYGDTMITALEKIFPNFGGDPKAPFEEGVLIWDIADPLDPKQLAHWKTGGTGTHRNLYAGGQYAHLAAGMAGFKGNIYVVLDISDRSNPREAGRWWLLGQREGETQSSPTETTTQVASKQYRLKTKISSGCVGFCGRPDGDVSLHGPPYVIDNTVFLSYGAAGLIVLDITSVSRPKQIGHLSFSPPFHSPFGVHSVLPISERKIAFVTSEDVSYGEGPAHHASIVDISDPSDPWLLALFPEPIPPDRAPYKDFYGRGGWCGPHNINHHQYHPDVEKQGDLFYIAHFNAGLRIYDVSNKRLPVEVGCFIPPDPERRYGPMPEGQLVCQTEDVVVDRRGCIYISDKNQGIWILRYNSVS